FSLGIVAGERFAIELTPSTFPQRHFAGDMFPQRHVAGEKVGMLLGKASNILLTEERVTVSATDPKKCLLFHKMVAGTSSKFPGPLEVDISGEGITDTRVNVLTSSANAVLSNDDLLIEILQLLPAISLLLYKSISNNGYPSLHALLSLYDLAKSLRDPSKKSTIFKFGSKAPAKILQSCNGLLLCYIKPDMFFVYNPCVNLFKLLPQPHMSKLKSSSFTGGIRLVFDPTESPHYKVVHAQLVTGDNGVGLYILIETYSSETGNWSVCADRIHSCQSFRGFEDGIYWNGDVHWLDYVYGSLLHSRLDILVDQPVLTTIKLPLTVDGNLCCSRKLFESRGCLLLARKSNRYSRQLHILEMRNVHSGWSVKYLVNLDDLMMPSPSTWGIHSSAWCIVLGEREEDSFMVIESHGKVLQYKIVLNTVHTLFDFGSTSPRESFPFIESFVGV
ncbi:retrovirus-related pol polyprotein from transposon TNT 1-94, partial [Tanacetum coccineum]